MAPLWVSFILIFALSCHEKVFWDPETKNPPSLDFFEIEPGNFVGEYGGAEWQISLPHSAIWNSLP
ncbi:MAG: hypothetical protein WD431_18835 [Cyclobacteriaceae bacterium]